MHSAIDDHAHLTFPCKWKYFIMLSFNCEALSFNLTLNLNDQYLLKTCCYVSHEMLVTQSQGIKLIPTFKLFIFMTQKLLHQNQELKLSSDIEYQLALMDNIQKYCNYIDFHYTMFLYFFTLIALNCMNDITTFIRSF